MKVALIHYWLVSMRGGEKVIESICDIYPDVDIYTNVYIKRNISEKINSHKIYTTLIDKLPFSHRYYQYYLPFMPMVLGQINLNKYDLIISSESGPAKWVCAAGVPHVCYCHSPMRYIWDMYDDYMKNASITKRILAPLVVNWLRKSDIRSADNVNYIIANSNYVAQRIKRYWNRKAIVIFPPVNVNKYKVNKTYHDYYLVFGQHVSYKKTDIAIQAFNKNKKKLIIMGTGKEIKKLKKIAGSNISFIGWQPQEVVIKYLSNCKALIFPGTEDFGIIPIEVMASGRPVIAFGKGGALETVKEGITGLFFHEPSPESLNQTINIFESTIETFDPQIIRDHAMQFDINIFRKSFKNQIDLFLEDYYTYG